MSKVLTPQEIIDINRKFKSYFDPEELVSKRVYDSFKNKDEIYDKFNIKLKAVIVYLREECFKVPFHCNNWKHYEEELKTKTVAQLEKEKGIDIMEYRGYREPEYTLGAKHSQHREWNAVDLDVQGFTAESARLLIASRFIKNLPFDIRIESGVNWLHIDINNLLNRKIQFFKV